MTNSHSTSTHLPAHGTPRRATAIWVALMAATLFTWAVGERGDAGPLVVTVLFALAFAKGTFVILDFMGLRQAPRLWPLLTLGWMALVCAAIGLAYWKGLPT